MATVAKFGITLQLIISYVLLHFVCREGVEVILFSKYEFSWMRWLLIEALLIGVMFAIAAGFTEITTVFSLTGAVAGVLVFYVIFLF